MEVGGWVQISLGFLSVLVSDVFPQEEFGWEGVGVLRSIQFYFGFWEFLTLQSPRPTVISESLHHTTDNRICFFHFRLHKRLHTFVLLIFFYISASPHWIFVLYGDVEWVSDLSPVWSRSSWSIVLLEASLFCASFGSICCSFRSLRTLSIHSRPGLPRSMYI